MITDLTYDSKDQIVRWKYNNLDIERSVVNVKSVLADSTYEFVLILFQSESTGTHKIIEFAGSGEEMFQINPPDKYSFYYLSHHTNAPISVVCQGPADQFGRTDYHFSVNTKNGDLKFLGLAY